MRDNQKNKLTDDECIRFFRDSVEKYFEEEYGVPRPLDKSFMNNKTKRENCGRWKRVSIIMAAILILCIGISIGSVTLNNSQAYADKGIIQRIYESIIGIDTDEHNGEGEEGSTSIIITDMKDIGDVKGICESLYIPKYIPQGYKLKILEIEKNTIGEIMGNYLFMSKSEKVFNIGVTYITDIDSDVAAFKSNDQGTLIKLKDREIYLFNSGKSVGVFTNDCIIMISGDLEQEEMVRIGKMLERLN